LVKLRREFWEANQIEFFILEACVNESPSLVFSLAAVCFQQAKEKSDWSFLTSISFK
jgi:hypothetical protein